MRGVGILGLGTVGVGVVQLIREHLSDRYEVVAAGVRDAGRDRGVAGFRVTTDLESVVDDPAVEVVVEVMGGLEPAWSLIQRAQALGKPVVTANKMLVASLYQDIGDLRFEAAVGAALPVVQVLRTLRETNRISRIEGILNGTTHFMLTRMAEGADYEVALTEAQELGYAEADPTSDVDGWDAWYKIAILGAMVDGVPPNVEEAAPSGIRSIGPDDIRSAHADGKTLKLIASWTPETGAQVGVQSLPQRSVLGGLSGTQNAVTLHGDFSGPITIIGSGAGRRETASAIAADLAQL